MFTPANQNFTKTFIISGILIALIISSIMTFGFFNSAKLPISQPTKLSIVASFYPLEFLAKEIGGDLVTVTNVTPAGSEPHEYEPTQKQIIDIQKADLLLTNGAGLESWTTKIAQNDPKPKNTLELTKTFELSELEEDSQKIQDPHIWLSLKNYIKMANLVGQSISSQIQKNQPDQVNLQNIIQANTQTLIQKLQNLDTKYRNKLASTNCKINQFVSNHDAFGYLAKDYGLEPISISGLSPEAEPTTKELVNLSELIKKNNIKYILTETIASPKLAQTLAQEVDITTLEMNPLEGLSDQELAESKNYITVMEQNLQNLTQALECR